ncbi:MAG: YfhO family protein [Acidobacteria bacterium]|nr:YfhO family protein [Acidobacteriota bacterium]
MDKIEQGSAMIGLRNLFLDLAQFRLPSHASPRAKDWLARLFLLFLPAVFFWRETLGWMTLADQDAVFWFFPAYKFAAEQISSGSFPLWNPYQYGGIPFFSEWQSGVLDPLNWIHWFGATSRTMTLSMELSFAIALLAMFSYARSLNFTRRASIFAAIVFGLSGFLVGRTLYPGFVRIVALTPLVLCFTERLSQRGRWRDVVFGALIVTWQIFAAHPQPLIYSSLLACAYALFRFSIFDFEFLVIRSGEALLPSKAPIGNSESKIQNPKSKIQNRFSFLLKFSTMFIAAICLAAIQLAPAFEFATKSVRQEWPFELFTLHSLHPASLLVTLFPFLHGSGKTIYSLPYWGTYWHHNEAQIYLGALALSLAAAGAIAAWKFRFSVGKFWSVVAIIGTILAMGKYSGFVAWLLFHFPLVSHFRSPNRHWMEVTIAVAVLAGYVVDRLILAGKESRFISHCLQASSAAIALLVCFAGGLAFWRKDLAESILRSLPDLKHLPTGFLQSAKWEFLLPMIVAVCACATAVIFAWSKKRATWFALLLAVLLVDLNLYAAFAPINNPAKLETLVGAAMPTELAAEQNQFQPIRYQMMLNTVTGEFSPYWFYGHEMMTGYDPVLSERQKIFSGLDEAGRSFNLTMLESQDRTLDIFNVRYVFVPPGLFSESLNDKTRWREVIIQRDPAKPYADYRIFENLRALPRVWMADKVKVAWEGDQLKMIRGQIVDPDFDPRTMALVDPETAEKVRSTGFSRNLLPIPPEGGTTNPIPPEGGTTNPIPPEGGTTNPIPPEGGATNTASIIRRSATDLVVETNTDKTSLLVLSEMFYPGWKATVDGGNAELLRVDYNLRGVQVTAGKHVVSMSYWPESLTKGAVISLTTALCLLAILIWEKRRIMDADAASELA